MPITFFGTRERVEPPKDQRNDVLADLKQLMANVPWAVLLVVSLLFNVYNSVKQGITIVYFTHYMNRELFFEKEVVSRKGRWAGAFHPSPRRKGGAASAAMRSWLESLPRIQAAFRLLSRSLAQKRVTIAPHSLRRALAHG